MHSFVETLRAVCRTIKPKRIIEWGPGYSTQIMREECGDDAVIISTEHDHKYAKIARDAGFASHVFEFNAACKKSRYSAWVLDSFNTEVRSSFDLAFVDGRRRVECALVAWMCLRTGGALVLHDSHRWQYAETLRYYLGDSDGGDMAVDSMTSVWVKR